MLAKDFLKQLALTRLKNTAAVDLNQTTGFKTNFIDQLIVYTNEALTNLYSEYYLLKKSVLLKLFPPYTEYYLRKEYALSDPTVVTNKYIQDTVHAPFYPYIIKIVNIFDQYGCDLLINDRLNCSSVHTISFDCVQFSHLNIGDYFSVVYLADHIPLSLGSINTDIISLPPIMYEMLKYLIASKYYLDLGKNSAEAQNNLVQYTELGNKIIRSNLTPDFQDSNYHLEQKGFV
jgi:hypothetical protein